MFRNTCLQLPMTCTSALRRADKCALKSMRYYGFVASNVCADLASGLQLEFAMRAVVEPFTLPAANSNSLPNTYKPLGLGIEDNELNGILERMQQQLGAAQTSPEEATRVVNMIRSDSLLQTALTVCTKSRIRHSCARYVLRH